MKLSDKIKLIRKQKGLTLKQFGELFDPIASDSIVSRWERGISIPNEERLNTISEMAGINKKEFLNENMDLIKIIELWEISYNGKNITEEQKEKIKSMIEMILN